MVDTRQQRHLIAWGAKYFSVVFMAAFYWILGAEIAFSHSPDADAFADIYFYASCTMHWDGDYMQQFNVYSAGGNVLG